MVNFYNYNLNNINNLIANGNITGENVFIPANIFLHTDDSKNVASAGVWYNITWTHNTDIIKFNMNHTYNDNTNDTVLPYDTGTFEMKFHGRFNDTAANPTSYAIMRVIVNGNEVHGSVSCTPTTKQNNHVIVSSPLFHVDLVAGDEIKVQFTAPVTTISMEPCSSSYIDHSDSASFTLKRIR